MSELDASIYTKRLANLELDFADAFGREEDERLVGEERLRELLTKTVDQEAETRRATSRVVALHLRGIDESVARNDEIVLRMSLALIGFLRLSWWERVTWALFGRDCPAVQQLIQIRNNMMAPDHTDTPSPRVMHYTSEKPQ
jgi:glutathionylspermidine synthase